MTGEARCHSVFLPGGWCPRSGQWADAKVAAAFWEGLLFAQLLCNVHMFTNYLVYINIVCVYNFRSA